MGHLGSSSERTRSTAACGRTSYLDYLGRSAAKIADPAF